MITVGIAVQMATEQLRSTTPTARLDAEVLLAGLLHITRARLVACLRDPMDDETLGHYRIFIERRQNLEPVAYILGEREFYGSTFYVDQRVLVPRPETELLIDLALQDAASFSGNRPLRIADIGTGSGAIAITMALHLPQARIFAVDVSEDALAVAAINVERAGVTDRVELLLGNGLDPLPSQVDMLLTNPPYTILDEIDENVRRHEPHLALDGGQDGLSLIRELIEKAPRYIEQGVLLMEFGAGQGRAIQELARSAFPHATITLHQDLAGHDRVLRIMGQVA